VIKIDLLAQKHSLNDRQTTVIAYLFEQEYLDIDQLETLCPGVTRRSLQRDLKALMGMGILQSHGEARATRYSLISQDL